MDIVFWIVRLLLTLWLLACPLVFLYWVFKPPDYFWARHRRISIAIGICAFFTFWVIIASGVELYLWFIPDNWTHETEDGEIETVRWTVASLFAFVVTCCLASILEKACREKHRQQADENVTWEIERIKSKLKSAPRDNDREGLLAELRAEKENLESLYRQDKLTPEQDRKLRLLSQLLSEVEEPAIRPKWRKYVK